ncbi:MAG: phosphatidate cytidylyltransferase [Candidatus Babeliales bacterium]
MHLLLTNNFIKRLITILTLGLGFWLVFLYLPPIYFSGILFTILFLIILFEWKQFFTITKPWFWVIMPFYPILPFALLIHLNHMPKYHDLLFILFVLVFSFDTGGYVVGTLLGKYKIHPFVSPHKTWEGVAGGYIFACISLTLLFWEQKISKPWWLILLFSFIVCSLSLAGDLFESWLKRRAHIKNSGKFLPGHGGFLDRFDGILFAVFFFYFLRNYLVNLFYY